MIKIVFKLINSFPRDVIKFAITGVINTGVAYLSFIFFVFLDVNYLTASSLAYILAVFNSYLLNKYWTFKSAKDSTLTMYSQFFAINLISLGVNLLALYIIFEKFYLNLYLSQAIALMFSMIFNYHGYKWLFNSK